MAKARQISRTKVEPNVGALKALALRLAFWLGMAVLALGSVAALVWGAWWLLYPANPHYTLRRLNIHIAGGSIDEREVRARLRGIGIVEEHSHLYRIDPGELRQFLEKDVLTQRAEVRREFPHTLTISLFGRTPLAQLQSVGGLMVDEQGVVLPRGQTKAARDLPVITPVPGGTLQIGDHIQQRVFLAALQFLQLRAQDRRASVLVPQAVILNLSEEQIEVYLRANPKLGLADRTVVIVPANDLERGLGKVIAVIAERAATQQTTSRIDATYERVPTLP